VKTFTVTEISIWFQKKVKFKGQRQTDQSKCSLRGKGMAIARARA